MDRPGLAENVVLALVAEGVEHGWAIGSLLAPDGELGRMWTLSRPLVYRAIDRLVDDGLVERRGTAEGRGRSRVLLRATARGGEAADGWLDEPVSHLRHVRTELLVKLALRQRRGRPLEPFVDAQRAALAPLVESLVHSTPTDPVDVWRREGARAVRRFLDALVAGPLPGADVRISARNQLWGEVAGIGYGDVLATVRVDLADGQRMTAVITREGVDELDLAPGDDVVAIVKSTEVMVGRRPA